MGAELRAAALLHTDKSPPPSTPVVPEVIEDTEDGFAAQHPQLTTAAIFVAVAAIRCMQAAFLVMSAYLIYLISVTFIF